LECTGFFTLDGTTPNAWEKYSGLYQTRDGHVRIHANFSHHRDGVLDLLELPRGNNAERKDVESALMQWNAQDFEDAAAAAGLVVAKARSFEEWDQHPHARQTTDLPLLSIKKIGDAEPRRLPSANATDLPLTGLRVLDLTRILAGPTCGRALALYGAEVMLVNSPTLPNIEAIIDTSRGKRSALLNLKTPSGKASLLDLARDAHVFVQGYRPTALAQLQLDPESLAEARPGIVYVSLSAYGSTGTWAERRGFDSLVQTATGMNHAEGHAAAKDIPKALPLSILDYASGFFMAYAAQVALHRQALEGGSWHVEVSLLQTANWLRSLGRMSYVKPTARLNLKGELAEFPCSEGVLQGMPHAAQFSTTQPAYKYPSTRPGADRPYWTDSDNSA
ncbi:MAG: CoA transferase, partial [Pseudomonadales bacterium]